MATFNANSNPPTTDGRDDIIGTVDADVIEALEGNDDISGLGGNDNIDAGDGNDDVVAGDGNDTVIAGEGSDKVLGGAGDDSLSGGDGKDKLYGGDDNDTIDGGEDKDRVIGGAGNDFLNGGLGSDKIYGGDGNDIIYGGSSGGPLLDDKKDLIYGGEGNDSIWGGAGNDRIMGEEGDDDLNGDDGDDKLDGGVGNDSLTGGTGEDDLKGKDGNDMLSGESDDDTLRGNSGEDTLYGGSGDDRFFGGKNDDLIYGDGDFFNGFDVDGAFGGDDDIKGGHGADTIYGEGGDDEIDGHKGHDYIHGGQGDDHILGGKGDDTLKGHLGDDFIDGEQHDDLFLHDLDHEVNDSDVYEGDHGIDTIRWYVTQDTWFSTDLQEDRLGYLSDKDDVRSEDHDGEKDDDELDLQNWDLNLSGFEHLEIEVDTTDNGGGSFGVAGDYDDIDPADRTNHDDLTDTTRKFFDNVAVYNNEVVLTDDDLNVSLGNVVIDEDETADFTFDTSVLENDDIEDWVLSMSMDIAGVRGDIITLDGSGDEIFIGSELNPQSFIDYGRFSYNVNDQWEALAQGETAEETFTYTVRDASHAVNGDEDTATVTITVTGRNDTHTFDIGSDFDNSGAAVKGDGSVATRNMSITDTDSSDDHTWSFDSGDTAIVTAAGTYGTWSITDIANGTHTLHDATDSSANWNYTLSGAAYQALAEGAPAVTDTITVYVTSDGGADAAGDDQISQVITVHIEGENDDPTLAAGNVATDEETPASINLSAFGNDVDNDDDGSSLTYTIIGAVDGVSIGGVGTSLEIEPATHYDDLNDGESLDVDVVVRATDQHGAFVDQTMTFELTGVNDDPTLAAGSDTINEDSSSTIDLSALGGDLDDENNGNNLTYSIVGGVAGASVGGTDLTYNAAGLHDALDAGDSTDVVITVRATDAQGATVDTDMTVTVQGVNDAPTIVAPVGFDTDVEETVDGAGGGDFDVTDVDASDTTHTWTVDGGASDVGTYGTLTFTNQATGVWTYVMDALLVDSLSDGPPVTDVFSIGVSDGNGGTDTTTVTINVTGDQDAISIDGGGSTSGGVAEDGAASDTGDFNASDVDVADPETWSVQGGGVGFYGTLSIDANGTWTYNLNNASAAVQNLDGGTTVQDVFTIEVTDNHNTDTETVTIDVRITLIT
ncbi:MAG: VCBS domain-containing protein [Pseudoprimorskyibacter sp.]|nr:VCBS domain-containing protein [Pseudoprimorskyibacter sp.]